MSSLEPVRHLIPFLGRHLRCSERQQQGSITMPTSNAYCRRRICPESNVHGEGAAPSRQDESGRAKARQCDPRLKRLENLQPLVFAPWLVAV